MQETAANMRTLRHFRSLTIKVSLMTAGMTLAVLAVITTTFVLFERQKVTADIYRNGQTFATFSAVSIYQNYTQFYTHPQPSDFENFKQNVQAILRDNTDIQDVRMVSLSGRVLFAKDEFTNGKYTSKQIRTINDPAITRALSKDKLSHWDGRAGGKPITTIVVPLRETGGGHFMSMVYVLSYDSLNAQVQNALRRMSPTLSVLIIGTVFGAVLFSLSLVRPILRLTRVAERLRAGDLNARAQVISNDEVGRLALTLNDMADQIKLNITDLEVSRAKIEEQNSALRRDKLQLEASLNSVDIGFIMTDYIDQVSLINKEALEVLAYTITPEGVSELGSVRHDWTTEMIAQKLGDSFPFMDSLSKARTQGAIVERPEVQFNGRTLRVFVAPIIDTDDPDNLQVLGVVTLLADVTEQKVLERSKEEFFSIASHELRTPLTAISGNAELIQTYYKEHLQDEGLRDIVADIRDSSARLIAIVNDFLDVSRAEQGRMHYNLTGFNIRQLAERVVVDLQNSAQEKGVSLQLDPITTINEPQVYGDSDRIAQVLYNLLGNALKFTPEGGVVSISIEQEGGNVKVYVKDTGMGIEPDAQTLLFHKFQQANGSLYTRKTEKGTGLGLYICKLMLNQMGGSMKIESSVVGKGSVFSFTMPQFSGQEAREIGGEATPGYGPTRP